MSIGDDLRTSEPAVADRMDPTAIGTLLVPAAAAELEIAPHAEPIARSQWQLFRRRFLKHKAALVSIGVLVLLFVVCFGARFFAPYDPNQQNLRQAPTGPTAQHWMGTDLLSRDLFSRLLYAGQISLKIGLAVALIATFVGTTVGAVAGYFGRAADQALMRLTDLFLVVPALAILAIALQDFGHTDLVIIFVLAGLFWMYVARCRIPPEYSCGYWSARCRVFGMPTRSSSSTTRSRSSRSPISRWTVMASPIWSPTLNTGFSAASASWNTIAMRRPRSCSSCLSGRPSSPTPRNRTSPLMLAVLGNRPRIAIAVTLLPEPDSPTMPSVSWLPTSKLTRSTA